MELHRQTDRHDVVDIIIVILLFTNEIRTTLDATADGPKSSWPFCFCCSYTRRPSFKDVIHLSRPINRHIVASARAAAVDGSPSMVGLCVVKCVCVCVA